MVVVVCRKADCIYCKEEVCNKPLAIVIDETGKCLNVKLKEDDSNGSEHR